MQSDKGYDKDSPINVILLAVVLCVVCSLVVSTAAVGLRSLQDANVLLDKRANILSVAGFQDVASGDVNDIFSKRFTVELIDMNTGMPAAKEAMEAMKEAGKEYADEEETIAKYDQIWASKSKKPSVSDPTDDATLIKYREKFSHVYVLKSEAGEVEKYVFPVRGYGLWSMMKGYLAVEPDLQKIAGLTFYEHGETPGLGGEIKSARFKAQWPGKNIYGDDGTVCVRVIKSAPKDPYCIDALSGATITSTGVSNMMKYWMGPEGFGPYIDKKKGKAETTMIKSGDTNHG